MQQPFWESAGGILRLGRTTQAGGVRSSAGFATTALTQAQRLALAFRALLREEIKYERKRRRK